MGTDPDLWCVKRNRMLWSEKKRKKVFIGTELAKLILSVIEIIEIEN